MGQAYTNPFDAFGIFSLTIRTQSQGADLDEEFSRFRWVEKVTLVHDCKFIRQVSTHINVPSYQAFRRRKRLPSNAPVQVRRTIARPTHTRQMPLEHRETIHHQPRMLMLPTPTTTAPMPPRRHAPKRTRTRRRMPFPLSIVLQMPLNRHPAIRIPPLRTPSARSRRFEYMRTTAIRP
ncbi:hypothetical protein R3P38DRAFT_3169327 [Favolaschia claudopus]|uniref:Uncharacterized protein n=1 Tax=Favolaschia claudopus TaxID=2862362 RepID=A0AAW0E0A7_9AGAR